MTAFELNLKQFKTVEKALMFDIANRVKSMHVLFLCLTQLN